MNRNPTTPDFFTVEEAAKVLRIGRGAAYTLARQWRTTEGQEGLPVITLGKDVAGSPSRPRAALWRPTGRQRWTARTGHLNQARADPQAEATAGGRPPPRHLKAQAPWQRLYFNPDPQGQGSLRPAFGTNTCFGDGSGGADFKVVIRSPEWRRRSRAATHFSRRSTSPSRFATASSRSLSGEPAP